jgi:large repetitive protein
MRRSIRLLSLFALAACLPAAEAMADPFPVTSTASSGSGSLRAAIEKANTHVGLDTIPIEVTGRISLETELPSIADDLAIKGPGAGVLTVSRDSGAPSFRIFTGNSGVDLSILDLTVRGGRASSGGGIRASGPLNLTRVVVTENEAVATGGSQTVAAGGGVVALDPLELHEVTISNNEAIATGGSSQTVAQSGGLSASDATLIDRSTISGNAVEAVSTGTQVVAQSAGMALFGEPSVVERSTISGNSATAANGANQTVAAGGGLAGTDGLTLSGVTVTGNSVTSTDTASRANLSVFGASVVRNTIISAPQGAPSCVTAIPSQGFNIDEDGSCGLTESSDRSGIDPGLDPILRDNGGATATHALLSGSPAIDQGSSFGSSSDQRGLPRPSDFSGIANREGGDGSDIGAFELEAPAADGGTPVLVSETPTDRTPPNTRIVSGPPRSTFKRLAKFRFASSEAQSHFQCKLDKKKWKACANPFNRSVRPGKHVFKVRAIDRFGNVDPTPARFGWRVKRIAG